MIFCFKIRLLCHKFDFLIYQTHDFSYVVEITFYSIIESLNLNEND